MLGRGLRRLRGRPANPEGRMSVLDHLRELRRRLILVVLFIIAGGVLGWFLYDPILSFLKHPYCSVPARYRYQPAGINKCVLTYQGVLDGFTSRLQISLISGAVLTAPLWLYQIWAFITPGLRKNERRYTIVFIVASTLLFAAGMALAYVVLTKGLNVLLRAGTDQTQAILTVNKYIGFVTLMLIVFGAAFELPLLVIMANLAGVLPARLLKKSQRLAIFLIFAFAAVATPSTDPYTMCAMALPMVVLYEFAVLFAVLRERRRDRRAQLAGPEEFPDDEVPSQVDAIPEPLRADESWADTT
ncbi:MAG: sec-independent protein translocase protein TatC [Pseudonocardiales bacterium]|jgi:sec-independent protein translocase protein TatC|nr:sec-independent protein translocase protein TatC [Pseudonocardiales bacterium]